MILIDSAMRRNPVVLQPTDTKDANNIALFQSVQGDDITAVTSLLDKGANPNYKRPYGNPWVHSVNDKIISITQNEMTVLMSASAWGNAKMVELLLERGVDVNAEDKLGNTALIWATIAEKEDIVPILVKHGAKVNHKNHNGRNALFYAVKTKTVSVLKQAGATE